MDHGEGKKVWIFPDGDLPEAAHGNGIQAHEALMVLNTTKHNAAVKFRVYFSDRDPTRDVVLKVEAQRVRCFRMDKPDEIGGIRIPFRTQYAVRIESDIPVIATFGRLDTTSEKIAYYTSAWHSQ